MEHAAAQAMSGGGLGLVQIAVFLAAAAIAAPLARMARIGSVLGYLAAGLIIGPYGVGVIYEVYDVEHIRHIAEFGVVMLLFLIGLELRPKRIWSMRSPIFALGGAQGAGSALVLMAAAILFLGYDFTAALFIGLSLSLSSTAFALQVLEEKGELNTQHGRYGFSVLLFQDLAAIPLIALVPLFAVSHAGGGGGMSLWGAALALAIIAGVIVFGHFVLNELYRLVAATRVREAMTASALLTVVGVALAMEYAGLSAAMGAFIAGVILADSEYRHQLEADLAPFVGLLLGLFFITIGMSLDVNLLRSHLAEVLVIAAGLVALKYGVLYMLGRKRGLSSIPARRLAMTLSQGGEFAFVLLGAGVAEGVLNSSQAGVLSLAVTLSMAATPLLLLLDDMAHQRHDKQGARIHVFERPRGKQGHIIIAGMGRFGQVVARILAARRISIIALDVNARQIGKVKRAGYTGYFGDASRLNILRASRVDKASAFVIAVSGEEISIKIAAQLHRHYPDIPVYARARNRSHACRLTRLGVEVIRRETFLSAVELGRDVLISALGEKAESVDRDLRRFQEHDRRHMLESCRNGDGEGSRRGRDDMQTRRELEEMFADK
jgi:glutathione-regulated potassium-efflux system protein KefB